MFETLQTVARFGWDYGMETFDIQLILNNVDKMSCHSVQ